MWVAVKLGGLDIFMRWGLAIYLCVSQVETV